MLPLILITVGLSPEHLIFIGILTASFFNVITAECEASYHKGLYEISPEGEARIPSQNLTIDSENFQLIGDYLCVKSTLKRSKRHGLDCTTGWTYDPDEFVILENRSALVNGEIYEPGTYILDGKELVTCVPVNVSSGNETEDRSGLVGVNHPDRQDELAYIGKVGAILSILSLSAHLIVFVVAKPLRNFPAYNLASLSVAFWMAYFFLLVGQIPEVLGYYCVASAALIYYFFLSSFFWMNAIAFDVWHSLRLATSKLTSLSTGQKYRLFGIYSLYAWFFPALFLVAAVVADHDDRFPKKFKPGFGDYDLCYFNNDYGKIAFFVLPAFGLLLINCLFFGSCAFIIIKNTMVSNTEQQSSARRNVKLYFRLGLLMGLTWLLGVVAFIADKTVLWYLFSLFNSLQGVFVFVLFTCTAKVWKYFRSKAQEENSSKSYDLKNSSSDNTTR